MKDLIIKNIMEGSPPPKNYQVTLENWRKYPYNKWSFVNVRNLIPTSPIHSGNDFRMNFKTKITNFNDLIINHNNSSFNFIDILKKSDTDAFLVMHKGNLIYEFFDNFTSKNSPHIIFSISKSLTSLLAGILHEKGILNLNKTVSYYLREIKGTAYEDATIRNVLDMNVASSFIEDYTGESEIFKNYRSSTGWDIDKNTINKLNDNGLHKFLSTMPKSKLPHGQKYHYCSPHSDLLGWILERASGENFSSIMSNLLFKPAGVQFNSDVTLDKWGASRSAGGISISLYDLLTISELVRCEGSNKNGQIIPSTWIDDFKNFDDNKSYLNQDNLERFPKGNYRSKWYQSGFEDDEFCAIGIHGQNIWINPKKELTIIRMSSASDPINIQTEELMFSVFNEITKIL